MSFPFYRQHDAMDCGPTCLLIIAKHYGRNYELDYLKCQIAMSRQGVSLLDIAYIAEKIGLKTNSGQITIEQLVKKALLPCIIHWNQNHFVVLYKIKKNRGRLIFYISDPGKGLLHYAKNDFLKHWISTQINGQEKGVVLLLEPMTAFYQLNNENIRPESKFKFLSNYFLRYKFFFVQLLAGLLISSLLLLIFPFLTQSIVDNGIGNKDIEFIWLILLAQLMLITGRTSIDFIRRRILLHISARINIALVSDFFIKLMKLPMAFFDTKLLGDLLQRIDDHSRIERFLTAQSLNMIFSFFSFIIFGIVLIIYSIQLFVVFLTGSIAYGIWILFFLKRRRTLDYKHFEQQSINRSATYQLINGMQEIKLQGCEQRKRWEWEDTQAELFDINMQILSLQQTQEAGSICINEIKNMLITVLAATAVIYGNLTLGMMLSVQYIIGQLNSPVEQIMSFIYQWQDVGISLERMSEIHNKKEEENKERRIKALPTNKNIIIKNLSFRYAGVLSEKVLDNINLVIPEGKVTAIVGASGSGKTTLIKLLLGNYSPTDGSIHVGEVSLNQFNLVWWRTQCGAVMQDGFIFSESIARNIAISDDKIDIQKLRKSANIANIDEFVSNLTLGYNTVVGQEGQGISQGQRQRLLIARAVYKNPQFIFLDEATNALDANNEKIILENLNDFYKGKTVIVVAHRLSTVKNADQIIVLDSGKIVEQGSHETLSKLKGKYYQLVKNQLELGD
ncbi:MAG: peptidase domain-containing ABC transporter [Bacteroidales bacterium]|jgi:ATP-binding cassette subfamily B protein|nr:peptidase domain-containing ABC transporter [Bacteroidales bacterium]